MFAVLLETPANYVITETRRCSRCGESKPIDDFPWKVKARGLRRVWCRGCCRAYGREHYRKNRPTYLAKSAKRRAIIRPFVRAQIDAHLRGHPCVDCGCTDITVLEFDHRDPAEKDFAVGELARVAEWQRVLREIEKCDVRCANCHRIRTGEQFGWAKVNGVRTDPGTVRPGASGRYHKVNAPRQEILLSPDVDGLRRCSRCGERKPLSDFPFRDVRAGLRGHYCRECQAEYRRSHYEAHKPDYMKRAVTESILKKQDILIRLFEYLGSHPCVDCGTADIRVLEFDHIDSAIKTMDVAKMIGRRSWRTILQEIEKCEVRCASCHRKRTAQQRGWKVRLAEDGGRNVRMTVLRGSSSVR